MVAAVIVVVIWAVASTCLYAGEYARRRSSEARAELEQVRATATQETTFAHDLFLRGLIDRSYDTNVEMTIQQREIIDKLLTPGGDLPEAPPQGIPDDGRLDIPPELTADWTDYDPSLWEPTGPGVIGSRPPNFPVPDLEDFNG